MTVLRKMDGKFRLVKNFLSRKNKPSFAGPWILGTLLFCYWMSYLYWNHPFGNFLAASPATVFGSEEYWRLFTSSFIHGDFDHFISNSFMLGIIGYFVSYHYGALVFPFLGFISGVLINLVVIWNYPPEVSLVGASGVVYWLWGFWLVLYIGIERQISLLRRLMKVSVVGLFILLPTEFKAQTSYFAHGMGLFLGLIMGLVYFFIFRKRILSVEVWEQEYEFVNQELENEALGLQD